MINEAKQEKNLKSVPKYFSVKQGIYRYMNRDFAIINVLDNYDYNLSD